MDLAVAALLQGENILLSGGKATGKNILADNLAWLFARPVYTVSFHVNTDSSTLIGTDTFTGGEVRLRTASSATYFFRNCSSRSANSSLMLLIPFCVQNFSARCAACGAVPCAAL